jgi:PAS domain S-box-containing protein
MNNESKAIKRPPNKLATLRLEIAELRKSEAGYKQKVEVLQKSEEYFRAIMQNSSDIIIIVDKKGTITYVNPSIERFLGYKPEELIGKSGFDFIMLADIPRAIYDFGRAIVTKDIIIPNAFRVRHKDGSEHVLEGVGNNLLNNPAVAGFVMNVRDITERKRAEEELRKHREHLEELVEKRTTELKTTNEQLQRDITDRKQAEEALRENETKFRTLFEFANDAIFLVDQYIFIDCNQKTLEMFGCTREQIIGQPPYRFSPDVQPDGRKSMESAQEKIETALRGQMQFFEWKHKRYDGTLFDAEVSLKAFSTAGKYYLQAIVRDITDRKRAEEALRESEEKYRSLVSSVDLMYLVDRECRYLFLNEGHRLRFGLPLEEIIGKRYADFHSEKDSKEFAKIVRDVIETGKAIHQERWSDRDGRYFLRTFSPSMERGPSGEIMEVVIVSKDVTDRKRVEDALRASEEKYRTIMQNIEDGYYEVDVKGNFTFFNESMRKILGYKREELVGMNNRQYADDENSRKVYQTYNRVYQTGEPVKNFEWQIIRKDGTRRDVEVSISLMRNSDDHPTGFRGVVQDTTDRRQAEDERKILQERLQRAEKMETLGTLAGGVAHDLNNVLGVIIGYSELLLNDMDESSSTRPRLMKIMKGGERAAAIVQDLLTMTRRGVSGRDVLNLNKIVADCHKSPEFEKLSSYHSTVRIKTNLEPDLLNISGSPIHLGKTLFNLVSNASEAMPKGGILTIKTANQYLDKPIQGYDEVLAGDYVVLSVSDTGEGISAADLKRIFEPFYTKKTMGRSGTGLGLTVVWGTVKDHDGYIDVRSEDGKGSTFTIYFPATREELAVEQQKISSEQYMGRGESILVIDDVKEQREVATSMLTRLGYRVHSVSSGEEAVEYLKTNKVNLLVLDMIMDPGIDGLDTYRQILEISPKQKAVIVSGFSETARVKKAQELGAGNYVKKPYILEKIGIAVRKELLKNETSNP